MTHDEYMASFLIFSKIIFTLFFVLNETLAYGTTDHDNKSPQYCNCYWYWGEGHISCIKMLASTCDTSYMFADHKTGRMPGTVLLIDCESAVCNVSKLDIVGACWLSEYECVDTSPDRCTTTDHYAFDMDHKCAELPKRNPAYGAW